MRARTVNRLATRSGGDGRRARWVLRQLFRAGDRGDTNATDALWGRWLLDGNDETWAALVDRPLAATGPADLRAVARHLARTPPDSGARPVLELLRDCLEHRFGAEVALGEAAMPTARSDDIALGGDG